VFTAVNDIPGIDPEGEDVGHPEVRPRIIEDLVGEDQSERSSFIETMSHKVLAS
jgi:hypothetical protein